MEEMKKEEEIREEAAGNEDTKEEAKEKSGKENRLFKALKSLIKSISETLKDYPLTMTGIILAALIGAVNIGDNYLSNHYEEYLMRLIMFFLLLSAQTLFHEEFFKKKIRARITGYIISACISAACTYILSYEKDTVFGISHDTVSEILTRYLAVYFTVMIGLSIYHMFRRLEENFEIFCTKAFLGLIRATVIYGLFAIGLGIIIFIFNELLFDTDDLVWQLELFLSGGIYSAMCLKAVSGKNETPGKFAKFCVIYVLQPMLLVSFAIIYAYIIKVFATDSVPSNTVFNILAFLFAIGMPIWTMVHGLSDTNTPAGKISAFIPYVFIPFIALQAWSMGIRIRNYGFTESRYCAVVLMICELLYFILYIIHHVVNKKAVSWMIFVLIAISALVFIIPGTSYDDVIIRSQMKRLEEMASDKNPSDGIKNAIKSSYREIHSISYKGDIALNKKYTGSELEKFKNYGDSFYDHEDTVYLSFYDSSSVIDISGYKMLYKICDFTEDKGTVYIIHVKKDRASDDSSEKDYSIDMSEFIRQTVKTQSEKTDQDLDPGSWQKIRIDEKRDLYITSLNMNYDTISEEIRTFNIEGYLLER